MANSSIIEHMLKVLDQYESKSIRAQQVEMFFEQYAQALEGVRPELLASVWQGSVQLVNSDHADGVGNASTEVPVASALEQLRAQVRRLHGESSPQILVNLRQVAP